jgi:hypothetical protein
MIFLASHSCKSTNDSVTYGALSRALNLWRRKGSTVRKQVVTLSECRFLRLIATQPTKFAPASGHTRLMLGISLLAGRPPPGWSSRAFELTPAIRTGSRGRVRCGEFGTAREISRGSRWHGLPRRKGTMASQMFLLTDGDQFVEDVIHISDTLSNLAYLIEVDAEDPRLVRRYAKQADQMLPALENLVRAAEPVDGASPEF